ncbi:methyltransferase [Micromonospora rifamycinica]|uniref:methyltransferase n=1 Tax=Micromonospora rifamycinica TaxID=291594 RepID=UPI002E297290|nr:methyltransferase [Micromonospora rifamycinica]
MNDTRPLDPTAELIGKIVAYRTSKCLYAVTALGIPALLQKGPASVGQLAEATGTRPDLLDRIMSHLVAEGVFEARPDGGYAATKLSARLAPDEPGNITSWVLCELQDAYWRSWDGLLDQLCTGETAFDIVHGQPFFGWLAGSQESSVLFDATMRAGSQHVAAPLASEVDVRPGEIAIDVGGGDGTFLAALLAAQPQAHGILFDLARDFDATAAELRPYLAESRCQLQHGSFFESIPSGDVLILKRILHDWPDDKAVEILRRCAAAARPGGRIVVLDLIKQDGSGKGRSLDVLMMVLLGGRERTLAEFVALFDAAGLRLVGEPRGDGLLSVLTAAPVAEPAR